MPYLNRFPAFLLLLLPFFTACENTSQSTLPLARGTNDEVLLVMDSTAWAGELGDELRLTFREAMPGLPQPEPYFDIRYVDPFKLNSVLRSAKNILFVTTLDNESPAGRRMQSYFTEESIQRIREEPNLYMFEKQDEFARGQEIYHLFGNTEAELVSNIQENRLKIRQRLEDVLRDRITEGLYKGNEQRSVSKYLLENYGFSLRVPFGYDLVPLTDSVDNFVWLRQLGDIDKSIVATFKDYTSEDAFDPENILAFREQQLGRHIADNSDAYMTVQRVERKEEGVVFDTITLVEYDTVTFQGKFAVETRGLWRLSNNSMGGGFLGYTFVDEAQDRLYYIEGYVYSPGEKKRPSIRELEAILRTFSTPKAGEATAAK
ncbi:MAG: DUF4837 family protein [Tunicatimonas sp.]